MGIAKIGEVVVKIVQSFWAYGVHEHGVRVFHITDDNTTVPSPYPVAYLLKGMTIEGLPEYVNDGEMRGEYYDVDVYGWRYVSEDVETLRHPSNDMTEAEAEQQYP